MEWSEVESRIDTAIREFLARDRYLLEVNANERSISHRLAMHLQGHFLESDVDCEYNRVGDGSLPKTLLGLIPENARTDSTDAPTVFPDIIVHKRGPAGPNLLVLEMKKSSCGPEAMEGDRRKLRAYLNEPSLTYEYAAFLPIKTGPSPELGPVERIQRNVSAHPSN